MLKDIEKERERERKRNRILHKENYYTGFSSSHSNYKFLSKEVISSILPASSNPWTDMCTK